MNPIFQRLNRKSKPNNSLSSVMAQVRSGAINPRDKVMEIIGNMDANGKQKIKGMLPLIQTIARKQGLSDEYIYNAVNELNKCT